MLAGELARDGRNLERAGHAVNRNVFIAGAVPPEAIDGAVEKSRHDFIIEPARDNADAETFGVVIAFEEAGHAGADYSEVYDEAMRNAIIAVAAYLMMAGCDPAIHTFKIVPQEVCHGESVTATWTADPGGLHLSATPATIPPLDNELVDSNGTRTVAIGNADTTFSLVVPGAGHREEVVHVYPASTPFTLNMEGSCVGAQASWSGNITASPGLRVNSITNNGSLTVLVSHAGQAFPINPGQTVTTPFAGLPAAGSYLASSDAIVGCHNPGQPTEVPSISLAVVTGCGP